jgi:hypothetical protein
LEILSAAQTISSRTISNLTASRAPQSGLQKQTQKVHLIMPSALGLSYTSLQVMLRLKQRMTVQAPVTQLAKRRASMMMSKVCLSTLLVAMTKCCLLVCF